MQSENYLIVNERSSSQDSNIVEGLNSSGRADGPWGVDLVDSFGGISRWTNGDESGRGVGCESQKNEKHQFHHFRFVS